MPNIRPRMARSVLRPHSPSERTGIRPPDWVAPLALLLVVAAFAACTKVTSDNIQLWKTTQKGPERLNDALNDPGVAPRLRAESAAALVDIGHADEVDGALARLAPDQ